jgi:hypothetical protein
MPTGPRAVKVGCCGLVGGACQPLEPLRCCWIGPEGWLVGWLAALNVKTGGVRSEQE